MTVCCFGILVSDSLKRAEELRGTGAAKMSEDRRIELISINSARVTPLVVFSTVFIIR